MATNQALTEQRQQQDKAVQQLQRRMIKRECRYQSVKQAMVAFEEKVYNLEKYNLQLEKQMAAAQEKIALLTTAAENAEYRIDVLRDDNRLLKQERANFEGQLKQLQYSV